MIGFYEPGHYSAVVKTQNQTQKNPILYSIVDSENGNNNVSNSSGNLNYQWPPNILQK
jgi:hypothetical protein